MGLKIGINWHQINGRNNGEPSEISQIRDVGKPAPEKNYWLKNQSSINWSDNVGSFHYLKLSAFLFNDYDYLSELSVRRAI